MTDQETISPKSKLSVLAIGGAGCRVMAKLSEICGTKLRLLAIDTDKDFLNACPIPEANKLLAAADWRNGLGCGGSEVDGLRAIAHERSNITKLLKDSEVLIVIGGLGGGTASGGVDIIKSICRKLSLPVLFLLTTPFSLEGNRRRRVADNVLRPELQLSDVIITLPNDLLFSVLPSTTPLNEAFKLADQELAGATLALALTLQQETLLSTSFNTLATVLRQRKSHCCLGSGRSSSEESTDGASRCQLALERMLLSPLLGGIERLKSADTVIFSLIGGNDLSLGEMRFTLENAAKKINPKANLITGASSDESFGNSVQICALAIKFDRAEELDMALDLATERKIRTRHKQVQEPVSSEGEIEQLKFELDTMSKGIMDKTTPVICNGEDLDFPTFQRQNITVDTGKILKL